MRVLLDSNVLTATFRRSKEIPPVRQQVLDLIESDQACLIGMVRQETLSGVATPEQYRRLAEAIDGIHFIPTMPVDYDTAADFYNRCRWNGIQGSSVDFLLCAVASRLSLPLFTRDLDFGRFALHVPVRLHGADRSS